MEIHFKYKISQKVFYEGTKYEILSRCYMETSMGTKIIKYNLRSGDDFVPNVHEHELTTLHIVK